ncbi:MAG: competence protein ComFB [Paenibacillus sp.]|jgi:competence protein ComFB|nr:competence protein ComFB [Paenibacillus sp.]
MNVHNLMEDIVKSCLKDLLQHQPQVGNLDEKLQSDIIAIALNKLPPRYVSTDRGEVIAKTQLRSQVETDVYRELANAIEKVLKFSRPSELR